MKFFHHNGIIEGKLYHSYYGHYIEEIEFCNGIKHGSYKKYDKNDKLIGVYNYENNMINGLYLDEYSSKKIKCEYKNGMKNGKMIMYNNQIYVKTYYVNDMEQGIHQEYALPSRKLLAQCEYKNNKKNGKLILFYNDTKLVQSYVDDKLHGFVFTYKKIDGQYMLANKIEYKNGMRDGIETIYIIDSNDKNDTDYGDDANVDVNVDAIENVNDCNILDDDFDEIELDPEIDSVTDIKILIEKHYKDDIKYKEINFMDNSESTFNFIKIGGDPYIYDEYEVEICTIKDEKTIIEKKTFTVDKYSYFENSETYDYDHKYIKAVYNFPYLKLSLDYYEFGVVDKQLFE